MGVPPSPLRLRRLTLGLTQQEVADAAGMNRQWLGVLEREEARPYLETAYDIAATLGCKVEDIFPRGVR